MMVKYLVAVMVLVVSVVEANAQMVDVNNYWSQSAAACSPTDANIQSDDYLVTGGTVKHKGPSTIAQINLMCGVEKNTGADLPDALFIAYRDFDGDDTFFEVVATLWGRNRTTGSIFIAQTVSSNSSQETGDTQWAEDFTHEMDFETFHYYVYASIIREGETEVEGTYLTGVALGDCEEC